MRNSSYFDITREAKSEADIQKMLAQGTVQFAVQIPVDFSRKLLRGEKPDLLLEADATDPSAVGYAIARRQPADHHRAEPRPDRAAGETARRVRRRSIWWCTSITIPKTSPNTTSCPGLMGVMLTMTMIIITALAITRERERGTMENLLSTPARPGEVMIGKIVPYIIVGYIQVFLILLASKFLFNVPIVGSVPLLLVLTFLFIVANLAVGITFSTIGKNQLAGGADGVLLFPAVAVVVRLHVSVPRHARLGAGHRRSAAADAFSAGRARNSC